MQCFLLNGVWIVLFSQIIIHAVCCPNGYTLCAVKGETCVNNGVIAMGSIGEPFRYKVKDTDVECGKDQCCTQNPQITGPASLSPIVGIIECGQNIQTFVKSQLKSDSAHYWKLTIDGDADVTFSTCGSDFDTMLFVYDVYETQVSSNVCSSGDDCGSFSCGFDFTREHFTLTNQAKGDYFIKIMSYSSDDIGNYNLSVLCAYHTITNNPTQEMTMSPTIQPSNLLIAPSENPSAEPTTNPSAQPTVEPTLTTKLRPSEKKSDTELLVIVSKKTKHPTKAKVKEDKKEIILNDASSTTATPKSTMISDKNMQLNLDSSISVLIIASLLVVIAALILYISLLKRKLRKSESMNESIEMINMTTMKSVDQMSNDEEIVGIIDLQRDKSGNVSPEMLTKIDEQHDAKSKPIVVTKSGHEELDSDSSEGFMDTYETAIKKNTICDEKGGTAFV